MATITATTASTTPALCNPVASAPAGDQVAVAANNSLLLVIDNGHSSPITVTLSGVASTITVGTRGSGSFTPTAISGSVTNATSKVFYIPQSQIAGYIDGNGFVQITYASGNAALTVQAILT